MTTICSAPYFGKACSTNVALTKYLTESDERMTLRESKAGSQRNGAKKISEDCEGFYDEYLFNRMFDLEIKRMKRSKKPFILILINIIDLKMSLISDLLNKLQKVFLLEFRETDIRGWYKQDSIIGIIFTDLNSIGHDTKEVIFGKTLAALNSQIGPDELQKIYVTFDSYSKDLENSIGSGRLDVEFNHELTRKNTTSISFSRVRKLTGFIGSFRSLIK